MVIRLVPGPDLATVLFLEGHEIVQVVNNKVVGDTGFEPVTSIVLGTA